MIVTSFVDLQEISLFPKFGRCGSKIRPATPISISNFSRAWQSFKVSYALQILEKVISFKDLQMTLLSFLEIFIITKVAKNVLKLSVQV